MKRRAGLTLIELMVTLTMFAIVLMAALPYSSDFLARRRVEGVMGELGADLQYARSIAVSQGVAISLTSHADGNGYDITGTVIEGGTATLRRFKRVTLPASAAVSAGITATFEPQRGMRATMGTDPAFVVSASGTAATLSISVNQMGRTQVCASGITGRYPACPAP